MIIGFLYQHENGTMFPLHMKAAMNKYINEANVIADNEKSIVARFIIKNKKK